MADSHLGSLIAKAYYLGLGYIAESGIVYP
jgi:hypothetical protein